ncbi:hypothetical protein BCR39DRAFT_586707 [Naematelia encephala]|uniref:Uncharacterized protein n=1 Tax=Naematelia encephala TaxID=71784 RepID=A0A1Y2BF28_9TREE|nr:hypothetical protein BCR39DRAFT_586707 [Naematelia encephala]
MYTHSYLVSLVPLLALVASSPVKRQGSTCAPFALQDYAAFQISDGTAGDARTQANAVFVDPFAGCDLSTVDATSLSNIQTMREAAETAETARFDPAIDAASGDTATALQNGKIKNKVLKLTGEIQALSIQLAQGKNTQSDIDAEQTKLDSNVKLDTAAAGQSSQGITNSTSTKRSLAIQPRKHKDHEKAAAACTATAGSTPVNATTADSDFTSTNGNATSIEGDDSTVANLAIRSIQWLKRHHKANKNDATACTDTAVGDSSSNTTTIDDTGSANDTSSTTASASDVSANSTISNTGSINGTSTNDTTDSSIGGSNAEASVSSASDTSTNTARLRSSA